MEWLKDYLISVTAAALICGIVLSFLNKKGGIEEIGKLLTGLFLCVTVVSPLTNIPFEEFSVLPSYIQEDCSAAVDTGRLSASHFYRESISERIQAYILDKAVALDTTLQVEVHLSEKEPAIPVAVTIRGKASPYAKKQLSELIQTQLGIGKEAQIWIP